MKIDKNGPAGPYARGAGPVGRGAPAGVPARQGTQPPAPISRTDSVQFSPDGIALSETSSLSDARLSEIHDRIESGHYNEPEVAEAVARIMIARLDV